MQSLEIVIVGQFHESAELRFDRVKGRRIQRLCADGGSSSHGGKSRDGEGSKKCLVHVGIPFRLNGHSSGSRHDVAFSRCAIAASVAASWLVMSGEVMSSSGCFAMRNRVGR